jgi:MFS transporter, FHS family, glucose/mannose:H+ symporter
MPQIKAESSRIFNILLHFGFFLSGIATVFIGQVLPILSTRFSLNDQQIAYLFPAQFAGSLVGTFLTNWLGKRDNFLSATLIGCFSMSCGILLINANVFQFCLAGFVLNGIGIGLTLPSINMLILEMKPENPASALNVLNVFWGVGAIFSQPFVAALSDKTNLTLPTSILAASLGIIGVSIALLPRVKKPKTFENIKSEDISVPIWTNPIAWGIALFNFIHVGFESGIGGWLYTYTQRFEDGAGAFIQPVLLFYIFFVIGRVIATFLSKILDENKMLILGLFIILFGIILIILAKDVLILSIGGVFAGLGTSSIFPTNLSRFTKTFGESATRRATPFFVCGTLGATFTTWLIGYISNFYGDLSKGMLVMLASVIFLIFLQLILSKHKLVI